MAAHAITRQREGLPAVEADVFLRAARGEHTSRSPVWAMRQAGRYLPEFRAMRAKADFFTMCKTPELCAEATLQPLRRFPTLDAVVIFSDILIVPQAMGLEVRMEPGPVFPQPLAGPADLARLTMRPNADEVFRTLYEGITLTRRQAAAMGRAVPVIGFCGAPWTLMGYCIDSGPGPTATASPAAVTAGAGAAATAADAGAAAAPASTASSDPPAPPPKPRAGGEKGHDKSRSWLYLHPQESHTLLAALTDVCIELLVGQYQAGASVLQVFESSGGELTPALFREFALPYLKRIAQGVRARTPPVAEGGPILLVFPRCQHSADGLESLCDSAYDGMSIDWAWDPVEVGRRVASECARLGRKPMVVQGNLDPAALFAAPETIARETARMIEGFRRGAAAAGQAPLPHICNLGHGMLPTHVPAGLGAFFTAVHAASAALMAGKTLQQAEEEAVAAVKAGPLVLDYQAPAAAVPA